MRQGRHSDLVVKSKPEVDSLSDIYRQQVGNRRLILVSNRGPVEHLITSSGAIRAQRGSGGVVTALAALGEHVDLTWIAAAMTDGDRQVANGAEATATTPLPAGLQVRLLPLPERIYHRYYNVFSNQILWFLQHYMLDSIYGPGMNESSRRAWENGYVLANRAFAETLQKECDSLAIPPVVLIQDYQLYLVAKFARELAIKATLQHFVHIPWPSPGYWSMIPRDIRLDIFSSLAANDIVGFQTPLYARNFLNTCEDFLDGAEVDYENQSVRIGDHICHVKIYPISIDVINLRRTAQSRAVRRHREELKARCVDRTIVRVDRLEPSKNILRGFEAYGLLLERRPDLRGHVKFLAFLVPSRTKLTEYQRYRAAVMAVVNGIIERFGTPEWRPIELFYENNYTQAIAGMSLADVVLVNPMLDGMNLVAKEAVIVNERNAALILSEGAGAFYQLGDAVLSVAAGDVDGTAAALETALSMPEVERVARLRSLRQSVESEDLVWWIRRQIEDLGQIEVDSISGRSQAFLAELL